MTEALEGTREFHDTYPIKVDYRGRIAIPPTYRTIFRDGVMVTPSLEHRSLIIIAAMEWRETTTVLGEETLRRFPSKNKNERMLFALSDDTTLDPQGRLTLKPRLRTYADLSLNSSGILICSGSHLEAWSLTEWIKHKKE